MTRTKVDTSAVERILDSAERRAQVLGFNGFSYADVAGELGVTPASIHYHFPSKVDLGVRLIERYTERFQDALSDIEVSTTSACGQLQKYAALYESVLEGNRLCLCGMMAAEMETLAVPIRERLSAFFSVNENWLTGVVERGLRSGQIDAVGEARVIAAAITGTLEGAMIVARAHGGITAFRAVSQVLLRSLCRDIDPI